MKKLIILIILIVLALFLAPKAMAEWQRLISTGDSVSVNGTEVYIIYDRIEHVNCYVVISDQLAFNKNRSNSIDCLPAK